MSRSGESSREAAGQAVPIGQLAVDDQLEALCNTLASNGVLVDVLQRAARLEAPNWYLTAGCLFQTVWNVVTARPPTEGIEDYDLFYFDSSDLSWEAEDRVIRRAREEFSEIPAEVEVRNEARVHLWYEEKFGARCERFGSTEDAIDSFAATTCCLGVRIEQGGRWRIYAPHGLSDVFNLVVRPNPVLAPEHVYTAKTERWLRHWPELTVLPWPSA